MKFKVTLLFNLVTGGGPGQTLQRQGGWTESLYADQANIQIVKNNLFGIQGGLNPIFPITQTRAALLPTGAQIVGQRIQQVEPVGPTTSFGAVYPGGAGLAQDVPQMSLLIVVPGLGVRNTRRWILRGMPDARVVNGEYSPAAQWTADFNSFTQSLGNWNFRALNLDAAAVDITSISSAGAVVTNGNSPFAQFAVLKIMRVQDAGGNNVSGKFTVATVGPNANNFTLANWTAGNCTGGRARVLQYIYPFIDTANVAINRTVVKKVGVPSIRYRGRRSKVR